LKFLSRLLLFISVALLVGFGLTYLALEKGGLFGTLRIGPWVAWKEIGSPNPDPYTRAYAAISSGLEMARAEGIKFTAKQDSDGNVLVRNCSYRIDGTTPESAFWTLAAIDYNGASITRLGADIVMHSSRINRDEDGSFAINVGPILASGNWLETVGTGNFQLVLNLYDSTVFSGFGLQDDALPAIILEGCNE